MFGRLLGKQEDKSPASSPQEDTYGSVAVMEPEEENTNRVDRKVAFADDERKTVDDEIIRDVLATSFLKDIIFKKGTVELLDTVTDVSFNGTQVRVQDNEKGRYHWTKQTVTAKDIERLGNRIAVQKGKAWNPQNPILDTEIGTIRVNLMHGSIAPYGETMALRISHPRLTPGTIADVANPEVAKLIDVLVQTGMSIMVSGQTGSGKTETQKKLVGSIPDNLKITLAEDTLDSHLKLVYPNKDINSWQVKKAKEEDDTIEFPQLIKAGLRNNPEWFLISEVRGDEATDLLGAGLTGHYFCSTIHTEGARTIPSRMLQMIAERYPNLNQEVLLRDIVNVLGFGIHMESIFTEEGRIERRIREVVEYVDCDVRTGVVVNPLFERKTVYDRRSKTYTEQLIMNKMSEEMYQRVADARLIHLVPDVFLPDETASEVAV
ncbi:hypothetical protein CN495_07595 [Bacillus thuringiensis]|uniref:Bacterial type II secretion system protein E domain-containing protein n=1 Tax=Bacillus thuringiensis TaxID=1428 RepID=A0ABD6SGG2_BACTU|nr:ATPase, T2SS/T4P/T4SS family [Bacillus thuringiensis]PER55609.1 hypothetical protein CN495_07595 [Bacillus thuringiensis]